tara:strand:+ start:799 stop:1095 length:297 start_codon:yes stop_codon:yes gene_type:complete
MGFEKRLPTESFAPMFDVRESRDSVSRAHMILTAAYGGVMFETVANFINYSDNIEVKMITNDSDKAPDDLDRLKQHAIDSFKKYIEKKKYDDYIENFK